MLATTATGIAVNTKPTQNVWAAGPAKLNPFLTAAPPVPSGRRASRARSTKGRRSRRLQARVRRRRSERHAPDERDGAVQHHSRFSARQQRLTNIQGRRTVEKAGNPVPKQDAVDG